MAMAIPDDCDEIGAFLVEERRQEDIIGNEEMGLGEFGEELEVVLGAELSARSA